jgi:hypothetical protein
VIRYEDADERPSVGRCPADGGSSHRAQSDSDGAAGRTEVHLIRLPFGLDSVAVKRDEIAR